MKTQGPKFRGERPPTASEQQRRTNAPPNFKKTKLALAVLDAVRADTHRGVIEWFPTRDSFSKPDRPEAPQAMTSAVTSTELTQLLQRVGPSFPDPTNVIQWMNPEDDLVQRIRQIEEGLRADNEAKSVFEHPRRVRDLMRQLRPPTRRAPRESTLLGVKATNLSYRFLRTGLVTAKTPTDGQFDPKAMLKAQVGGQDEAIASVARRIWLDHEYLRDPSRPIGAHLLAGPSGDAMMELAKVTADVFYKGAIATLSCDSLQGRDELAEIIRGLNERGGGILLFDEIEKARSDIFRLITQIIDNGIILDAKGRDVDCSRIHILMTSNLGSDVFAQFAGDGEYTDPAAVRSGFDEALKRHIPPEVLGRILGLGSIDIFRPRRNSDRLRIVERERRRTEIESALNDLCCLASSLRETLEGAQPASQVARQRTVTRIQATLGQALRHFLAFERDYPKSDGISELRNHLSVALWRVKEVLKSEYLVDRSALQ